MGHADIDGHELKLRPAKRLIVPDPQMLLLTHAALGLLAAIDLRQDLMGHTENRIKRRQRVLARDIRIAFR